MAGLANQHHPGVAVAVEGAGEIGVVQDRQGLGLAAQQRHQGGLILHMRHEQAPMEWLPGGPES